MRKCFIFCLDVVEDDETIHARLLQCMRQWRHSHACWQTNHGGRKKIVRPCLLWTGTRWPIFLCHNRTNPLLRTAFTSNPCKRVSPWFVRCLQLDFFSLCISTRDLRSSPINLSWMLRTHSCCISEFKDVDDSQFWSDPPDHPWSEIYLSDIKT